MMEIAKNTDPDNAYGTYRDFIKQLKEAFGLADTEAEARYQLEQLRQGQMTADEYVNKFKVFVGEANLSDSPSLQDKFQCGLNKGILRELYSMTNLPNTIEDWYKHACRQDSQWKRFQSIAGRELANRQIKSRNMTGYQIPKYTPFRDPNAM